MNCLVTGAGGFLGSELVRQLIAQKHMVRALFKENEGLSNLGDVNVEVVRGDVRDKNVLREAVRGVDYVFHAASVYELTPFYVKNPQELYDINVEGAKNICEASLHAKVKKLVYTGSTAAVGLRDDKLAADESIALNILNKRSHYEKSKAQAQQIVLSYRNRGLWVVSVNPSFLIGAGDSRPSPTGEVIVKFLNRQYPCYFDAILCLSDVKSAAQAHINALQKGQSGESYIVANDQFFTLKELFQMLEKISGIPSPKLKFPLYSMLPFSMMNEAIIGLLGLRERVRPLIAFELVRYLTLGCTYDSSKAHRELGFKASPMEDILKESVNWYTRNGYVRNF